MRRWKISRALVPEYAALWLDGVSCAWDDNPALPGFVTCLRHTDVRYWSEADRAAAEAHYEMTRREA